MTDPERRINRAVQCAREVAQGGLSEIRLKRFHRAMDELEAGEGEQVYARIHTEPWYERASAQLKREQGGPAEVAADGHEQSDPDTFRL